MKFDFAFVNAGGIGCPSPSTQRSAASWRMAVIRLKYFSYRVDIFVIHSSAGVGSRKENVVFS